MADFHQQTTQRILSAATDATAANTPEVVVPVIAFDDLSIRRFNQPPFQFSRRELLLEQFIHDADFDFFPVLPRRRFAAQTFGFTWPRGLTNSLAPCFVQCLCELVSVLDGRKSDSFKLHW